MSAEAIGPPRATPWQRSPDHLAVFTSRVHRASYDIFVTPAPMEAVLRATLAEAFPLRLPGAWRARRIFAADAFGSGGDYDRSLLARLYGGRSPAVARGAVLENGRVAESWTLISPYPDPTLRRLEAGTLLLVLRVP